MLFIARTAARGADAPRWGMKIGPCVRLVGLRRGLVWVDAQGCFGDPVASVLLVSTANSLVAGGHPRWLCGGGGLLPVST